MSVILFCILTVGVSIGLYVLGAITGVALGYDYNRLFPKRRVATNPVAPARQGIGGAVPLQGGGSVHELDRVYVDRANAMDVAYMQSPRSMQQGYQIGYPHRRTVIGGNMKYGSTRVSYINR
jgi:hypothetical protein